MRWLLARRVLLYLKLDQWEITFQSLHEIAELDVFRNISAYFLKILVELLAKEEVIEQTQVEAAHEDEEAQVEQVQQVCHEIQEEFDLNQVNFCLVVVLDRLLSVACFLVVCRSLLLLIFYDPDSGCLVLLEAVDVCMAKDLSAKDVHQAVVGRWNLFFNLPSVSCHDAHGLGIAQLSYEAVLLLRDLYESEDRGIGQEHVFRYREALNQLHRPICILKVPEQ